MLIKSKKKMKLTESWDTNCIAQSEPRGNFKGCFKNCDFVEIFENNQKIQIYRYYGCKLQIAMPNPNL